MTEAFNVDCMVAMKQIPDKFYTLAIVDPPYGGGVKGAVQDTKTAGISSAPIVAARTGGKWFAKINGGKKITRWDIAPTQEYFDELARVSENQIIWGGGTILGCRLPDVSWCGTKPIFQKTLPCQCASMPGQALTATQRYFAM